MHVAPEILRRYVGTYAMESPPGFKNHITLEADHLMTQVAGQSKVPLFAESETKFFLKVAEAEIEFVKNEQSEVTDLIIHQNGADFKMTREKSLSAH